MALRPQGRFAAALGHTVPRRRFAAALASYTVPRRRFAAALGHTVPRRRFAAALAACAAISAVAVPARANRGEAQAAGTRTLELVAHHFGSDGGAGGLEHRVAQGETLSAIAAHYGVSVEQILQQNPDLDPDHVRAGRQITIPSERERLRVIVAAGETLIGIAKAHGVTLDDIVRWNPGVTPDRVREGQALLLLPKRAPSMSESVGSPARGELLHGHRLPPGPGYRIRSADRAYATDETVRGIVAAFQDLRRRDPRAPRLAVHDLSLRRGGPMHEHRSHQSGRDADIAYPQQQCEHRTCDFRRIGPGDLDARRAFELLHYWLERDMLEAVFIDYRLQAPLYRYARDHGASAEELQRWFQYPHGHSYPLGIIRHFPKHDDHMHVRFACANNDPDCITFRPLLHTASR